jgi:hypothetical protein
LEEIGLKKEKQVLFSQSGGCIGCQAEIVIQDKTIDLKQGQKKLFRCQLKFRNKKIFKLLNIENLFNDNVYICVFDCRKVI